MNYNDKTTKNMNDTQIYQKISDLATKLGADNSTFTRADLAYELKELGVSGDSADISRLVWEALNSTGNQQIAKAFVNNSKSDTLVNEYKVPAMLEQGDTESVFDVMKKKLSDTDTTLGQLSQLIDEKTKLKLVEAASTLIGVVSGTNSINKIQSEASAIFMKYKDMADTYKNAKDTIASVTNDFCEIRTSTVGMYRRYAIMLTDIFGDSIRTSMPELFDFSKVEYLDVEAMTNNIQLAYNQVYGKCATLAGEVSENFTKALKDGAVQFGAQQDKRVGLVLAGINLISHYMKTGQQAQNLSHDLAELKGSITHDVASIRTDQVRLVEIYKTIHDVMVPKAEVFAKAAPTVFDDEFSKLVDTIYSTRGLQELRDKREDCIAKMRDLERKIADAELSISYYQGHITDSRDTMESLNKQYTEAKSSKPEPPSGFGNIITFGTAKKNYNRDIYEWSKNCEPLVKAFEALAVDVKVDEEELSAQKQMLADMKAQYASISNSLNTTNNILREQLDASPEVKAKAAQHLEDIIKLLQLAKDIASQKLDDRLVGVSQVKKFHDIELPENLKTAVQNFRNDVVKDMNFSEADARDLAGENLTAEQAQMITAQGQDIMNSGISLCENMARLSAMKLNQGLAQEYYDMEFAKIKAEFAENIKKVDNQALMLQEIARRVNTSDNAADLKAALMALLGDGQSALTADNFDDFLTGKLTINI